MTSPTSIAIFVLVLAVGGVASSQDKTMQDTLGTRLTATAETIVLEWDVKHPWSADLSHGATLIAEYDTRNQGIVLQKLATGKPAGGNVPSMRFVLPAELTVSPTGPVCLFIQLGNSRILPVRKPAHTHDDTSRFRDVRWESQTASQTQAVERRRYLAGLQAAAEEADRRVQITQGALEKKGWTQTAGCEGIAAPNFAVSRPRDVLPISEQPEAARRACITRVVLADVNATRKAHDIVDGKNDKETIERYIRFISSNVLRPDRAAYLLASIKSPVKDEAAQTRQTQLNNFKRDWAQFSTHIDNLEAPLLGDEVDTIDLQTFTGAIGASRILPLLLAFAQGDPASSAKVKFDPADIAGFAGGEIEAYSRCVVDSEKQFSSKLEQWQANQANAPRLGEMARKQLVTSCQNDLASLAALVVQQTVAHERIRQAQQIGPDVLFSSSAPEHNSILNSASCSVRR